MDLSIIIVTWNTRETTLACLHSIYQHTTSANFHFEVLLIDNGSRDGTTARVKQLYPQVRAVRNEANLGFARAVNLGLKEARGEFVLLLNSDTLLREDAIGKTYQFLADQPEDIAAVACRLINHDGTLQVNCRQFYSLSNMFKRSIGKAAGFLPHRLRASFCIDLWDHDMVRLVDWVNMAFFMFRRSVVARIGDMDERFSFYGEDMDFCYRLWLNNFKVIFFPGAVVVHLGGLSSQARFSEIPRECLNALYLFYDKYGQKLEKWAVKIWFNLKGDLGIGLR